MILAKVTGTIVATISTPDYKNRRLLTVRPLVLDEEGANEDFIALDNTHAGIGDTVLINREGGGNRQVLEDPESCVNSVIVAIVDSVNICIN
jgi:microcompartment protein CcmK/EutM